MRPRLILHLALLALLVAAAQPALAGTAYVPVTANLEIGSVDYQTVLWLSNVGSSTASFTTRFIPTGDDGTPDPNQALESRTLIPGGTFYVAPLAPEGSLGILEISTASGIVAQARLVGTPVGGGETLGADLPVVTSKNSVAANGTANLIGLERNANQRRANLGILNLGTTDASCSVKFFLANDVQIQQTAVIEVPPLGHREFYDALGILGQVAAEHVRASVSCDQQFYAYSSLYDVSTGEVAFTGPAMTPDLADTSNPPTDPPPSSGGSCPSGAICFSRPGVFYRPSPQESVRRETFPLDNGVYSKIHFRVEVFHGGWQQPTSGFHSLYWLAINRHFRLVGFSGFHGPNKNDLLFRHGMNIPAGDKPKFTIPFTATPGQTYVCDFTYDAAGHSLVYNLLDTSGNILVHITDRPNVNHVEVGDGEDLVADFSTQAGQNPVEPPTFGWEYRNLTVEVYP
jgi:hypothetical protein